MNESKVYLTSTSLEMANNQNHFMTNQYIDFIKEQQETNLHLMNAVSELKKSCQTILNTIRKQEAAFNAQKSSQKHNQIHLKNMLLEIALANQGYQAYVDNQERSIRTIMDYLVRQDEFNNLSVAHSNKQAKVNHQLLSSIGQQEAFLQNQFSKQDALELINQIEIREAHQKENIYEVKELLEKLLQAKASISKILSSLPPNYPIKQLVISGVTIPLNSFVLLNEKTGVAVFSNDNEKMYFAIDKIEAIHWT